MLEIKKVSPLLDEFALGKPFSDRFGVVCYPAVHSGTNEKYILKRISIPESQTKADALVLTGACVDKDAAQVYFEEQAQNMVDQINLLKALSQTRGFASFHDYQLTPKEKGQVGVDLWLLCPYRTTLSAYMRRGTVTHLEAVNLGIDLCAALTLCRKTGYLYLNIRPENIFITPQRKFQLGDLGLLPLDEMYFAILPDHCRSEYTPPELHDAMAEPNETMDLYALGMTLYSVYNEGKLPGDGNSYPGEFGPIDPPAHAEAEMAAIILKAIDFKRENRWQTPEEMGQALVAYMQSHAVNDQPILAATVASSQDETEQEASEEEATAVQAEAEPDFTPEPELGFTPTEPELTQEELETGRITTAGDSQLEAPPVEDAELADILSRAEMFMDQDGDEESQPQEEQPETQTEEAAAPTAEEDPQKNQKDAEEDTEGEAAAGAVSAAESDATEEKAETATEAEPAAEEAAEPDRVQEEASAEEKTGEENADESLPVPSAEQNGEDADDFVIPHLQPFDMNLAEVDADSDYSEEEEAGPEEGFRGEKAAFIKKIIAGFCALVVVALLIVGGYYYYQNIYCMPISRFDIMESTLNSITVEVQVRGQEELLLLSCQDNFGNSYKATAFNGRATFEDLQPNTQYMIVLSVDGFHQLLGNDTLTHTTAIQTEITSFTAVTGAEDGSVSLKFEADGTLPNEWTVTYEADGEPENYVTFQGDSVVITGLTVGKNYTFTLTAGRDVSGNSIYLSGSDVIEYVAMPVITAQNLTVSDYDGKNLTLSWDAPAVEVPGWSVRCYNSDGTDVIMQTATNSIAIPDLDSTKAYSFEVKALGMTQSAIFAMTANPIFVHNLTADDTTPGKLVVSWEYFGNAPEKWLIMYSYSADPTATVAMQTEKRTLTIDPVMPNANYVFQIHPADGSTVFGGDLTVSIPECENLNAFGITNSDIIGYTFHAPNKKNWELDDIDKNSKTATFMDDSVIGFALEITSKYEYVNDEVYTLIVVRNEAGEPVDYTHGTAQWHTMWTKDQYLGELPRTPQTPGNYTIEVYFNYAFACAIPITVAG